MGDVMSLIEKTQGEFDEDQAADLERKIRKQQFTLDDFLTQMKQVRRMGPLGNLMKMVPGMGGPCRAWATSTSASSTGSRRSSSR